jgi:hypothetical protein
MLPMRMAAIAAAGAGNAADATALAFPWTMDIKITEVLTVAGMQSSRPGKLMPSKYTRPTSVKSPTMT